MAQRLPGPNDVIERADGLRVRVLLFEPEDDVVHVIDLAQDLNTALPSPWSSSELLGDIRSPNPQWRIVQEQETENARPARQRSRLTRRTKAGQTLAHESDKHTDKRWDDVDELLQDPAVYWKKGRRATLDKYAVKLKTTWKRLLRVLRLAWIKGMTRAAVRVRWDLSGIRKAPPDGEQPSQETLARKAAEGPKGEKEKRLETARIPPRRGCPPTKPESVGKPQFPITPELEQEIADTGLAYLAAKDHHSRRGLYDHLVRVKFSYVDDSGALKPLPEGKRPNRRQVRYIIDKVHDPVSELRRKLSASTMANDKEPKLGNRLMDAHYAGHIYEIDATVVDIWVVDREDKSIVLGKPTLYLIIDVFSRLLVSFHLTLDPPSWAGASAALMSIVDRKGQCAKYGYKRYRPDLDVAEGVLGKVIRADRGKDVANDGTVAFAKDLKRAWENTAGKRGSLKGIVEVEFKLIHVELKDEDAGYVPPRDVLKRTGKGYRYDQKLNLDELRCKLFSVQDRHNLRKHPGMRLPKQLIAKRVPPRPYLVWQKDEEVAGPRPRLNAMRLRDALLTRTRAVVTQLGIEVPVIRRNRAHCLHYSCDEAVKADWFIRARKRRFEVDVRYDRDLTSVIRVTDPYDPRFEYEATLTEADAEYRDTDFATVAFYKGTWEELTADADEFNMTLRNQDKHAQAEEDAAIARKSKEDLKNAGGKPRVTGNAARRRSEAHQRAVEEAQERAGLRRNKQEDQTPNVQAAPELQDDEQETSGATSRRTDFKKLLADPRAALRSLNHD